MGEKKDSKTKKTCTCKNQKEKERLELLEYFIRLENDKIIKELEKKLGGGSISFDSFLDKVNDKVTFDIYFGEIQGEEE